MSNILMPKQCDILCKVQQMIAAAGGVSFVDIVLTPEQVLNLHTTPVLAIPAPGAGKYIMFDNRVAPIQFEGATSFNNTLSISAYFDDVNPYYAGSWSRRMGLWSRSPSASVADGDFRTNVTAPGYQAFSVTASSPPYAFENKAVYLWNENNSISITPPTLGDQTVTMRLYYRILDVDPYTPLPTNIVTDIRVQCTSGTYTPFDGTETGFAVSYLYTAHFLDMTASFVLNPVYEGAGIRNLGQYTGPTLPTINSRGITGSFIGGGIARAFDQHNNTTVVLPPVITIVSTGV